VAGGEPKAEASQEVISEILEEMVETWGREEEGVHSWVLSPTLLSSDSASVRNGWRTCPIQPLFQWRLTVYGTYRKAGKTM
jgi:hypothetical protein